MALLSLKVTAPVVPAGGGTPATVVLKSMAVTQPKTVGLVINSLGVPGPAGPSVITTLLPTPSGSDDTTALNAAITAASAGAILAAPPNVLYKIASTWTINKAVTIRLNGATVQKIPSGAANYTGIDCTVDGVIIDGGHGFIDGNRSAQASTSGVGIRNSSTGKVIIRDLDVHHCGASGVISNGAAAAQLTVLRNVESHDNLDPSIANNASGFSFAGNFRAYGCEAHFNDKHGFNVTGNVVGGTGGGSMFDGGCKATHNTLAGFFLGNTGSTSSSTAGVLQAFDNGNYGVNIQGGIGWTIASIVAGWEGNAILGNYEDGTGQNPSGAGLEIQSSAANIQIGSLLVRSPSGYGCAINNCNDVEIGDVIIDGLNAYDSDPGVQCAGGATDIHLGVVTVNRRSVGVSIAEASGGTTNLHIGILHTHTCPQGVVHFGGGAGVAAVNCTIDHIIDHDSYTTNATYPGLIDFFNCTGCRVGRITQYNGGANVPTYIVHGNANSNGCTVETFRRAPVFGTSATNDAGLANDFPVMAGGMRRSAELWTPAAVIGETIPRNRVPANQTPTNLVSGTLYLAGGIVVPAGVVTASGTFWSGTTALTIGSNADGNVWFVLIRQVDKVVVAQTAGGPATTWAANSALTKAWTTSQTDAGWAAFAPVADTAVYLGLLIVIGTGGAPALPTLAGITYANTTAGIRSPVPVLCATGNTTGLTTPPANGAVVNMTNTAVHAYGTLQ